MLASRTPRHSLARDIGAGIGQAALCVAQHYDWVITTDASTAQLKCAIQHPRVHYVHTPIPISNDEIMTLIRGENSVDLITVAQAVYWFDLPNFYSLLTRLLWTPGGVVAVWCYNDIGVSSTFDPFIKRFHETTLPFWDPNIKHISDGYEKLPFPFESVGLECEGEPAAGYTKGSLFRRVSEGVKVMVAVTKAKERGLIRYPKAQRESWRMDGVVLIWSGALCTRL